MLIPCVKIFLYNFGAWAKTAFIPFSLLISPQICNLEAEIWHVYLANFTITVTYITFILCFHNQIRRIYYILMMMSWHHTIQLKLVPFCTTAITFLEESIFLRWVLKTTPITLGTYTTLDSSFLFVHGCTQYLILIFMYPKNVKRCLMTNNKKMT